MFLYEFDYSYVYESPHTNTQNWFLILHILHILLNTTQLTHTKLSKKVNKNYIRMIS